MKRTIALGAACVLAASMLVGCGGPNPREPAELEKFVEMVKVEDVWTAKVGKNTTGLLVPAVTQKAIYAAGEDTLYRIDPATGDTVWSVDAQSTISAGVASDGQVVALGTDTGLLQVFSEAGKELWHVKLSSEMSVPPLVINGLIVVRTSDTRVSGYDALTGERRWRYQSQAPALSLRIAREMRFSPAGVLIGQSNGKLLALDGTGKPVFDVPIAQARGTTEVERLVDVVGTPLVDAKMMCAAAYQGNVVCIDAQDGHLLWRCPVDAASGPVTDGKHVYVTAANGEIYAFDYESGAQKWKSKEYLWRSPSAPVVVGEAIAVGDFDGELHVLDPNTGKTIGRMSTSGAVKSAPVPFAGGALFQTDKGRLVYMKVTKKTP